MHSLGRRRRCEAERRGKEAGAPRSRNQGWWTLSLMIECIKPVWTEEERSQEGGGQSSEEYGGRTVPKA